ncbi:helix-turn-helix domain-containing protein [Pedobacter sp. HDW13]|uniref:helix-turn-helix domain-containing protein n=1 Tax=Pedobacter sp. HDW13 TaxID=2714940 RepID=UPI00140DCD9F|nr:helix-turn-helix domain-containing protein [Pedobacter sp. HDW13]QIL41251.1 helix-turn-helix domain-containing protein [Pedobacter sp. HDW13]
MKNIREKLGLSQDEMSNLLGMNRSTAGMYEIGSRSLSTWQLKILSKIEMLLQAELEIAPSEKIKIKEQESTVLMIKNMEQRIEKAAFVCLRLKRRLKALTQAYTKTQTLWTIIKQLRLEAHESTQLMAYLDLLEISCLEKIESCGPHLQAQLSFRIKKLEHEQKVAQMIIDEAKID